MPFPKLCKLCGKKFPPTTKHTKLCEDCRSVHWSKRIKIKESKEYIDWKKRIKSKIEPINPLKTTIVEETYD